MVLLLISAPWMLAVSLVASLCIAARNGDLQYSRPPSPAVGELMDPSAVVTITPAKQGQRTTPGYARADAVPLSPRPVETIAR